MIAGLLCLLLSDLKSNSTLGPVAAIGIVFAMLSALTLLPALLLLFGRAVFWPRRPRFEPEVVAEEHGMRTTGLWARLSGLIKKRPASSGSRPPSSSSPARPASHSSTHRASRSPTSCSERRRRATVRSHSVSISPAAQGAPSP